MSCVSFVERSFSPPERVPGNYYFFEVLIEITIGGTTHLGYPKRPILNVGETPPVVVWGSPVNLAWPNLADTSRATDRRPEKRFDGTCDDVSRRTCWVQRGTLGDKRY